MRTWLRDSALWGVIVAKRGFGVGVPDGQTWLLPTLYAMLRLFLAAQFSSADIYVCMLSRIRRSGHKNIV